MDQLNCKVDALLLEIQQVRESQVRLEAQVAALITYIAPSATTTTQGVVTAIVLAQRAVFNTLEKLKGLNSEDKSQDNHRDVQTLNLAANLLTPPALLTTFDRALAKDIARAYDLVLAASKAWENREVCERSIIESRKKSALCVREVLVLEICCRYAKSEKALTEVRFESELEDAFGRSLGQLVRSQLRLARAAICRLASDYPSFISTVRKIFDKISEAEMTQVYSAYVTCGATVEAIEDASRAAKSSVNPRPKRSKKPRKPKAADDADHAYYADHEPMKVVTDVETDCEEKVIENENREPAWVNIAGTRQVGDGSGDGSVQED